MARRHDPSKIGLLPGPGLRYRRRPLLVAVVFLAILGARPAFGQVEVGQRLYETNCATCHGPGGGGTESGPSITQSGAAAADFQLRTGRMPLPEPGAPVVRKPPAFGDDEIDQIVAYIDTLGQGPDIPTVDITDAVLSEGAELFASNCAACHGATANGGAVGGSAFAPSLDASEPLDVAEATLIGPGEMPRFAFTDDQRNAIAGYVDYLQDVRDPGGLDIGGVGPVPEGFVAWAFGMVALVAIAILIGRERRRRRRDEA